MKKKLVLILAALMCISLCACGGSESTNGDNKEEGFTPTVTTETEETETKEETITAPDNMTVEEMQKYYDVTQYIGTPRYATMKSSPDENPKIVDLVEIDANGDKLHQCSIEMVGKPSDWMDEEGKDWKTVQCIIVDNNTPEDYTDDTLVYIFNE